MGLYEHEVVAKLILDLQSGNDSAAHETISKLSKAQRLDALAAAEEVAWVIEEYDD